MSADKSTRVQVRFDRKPTIEDVQYALDVLRAEGIPDSFEVDVVNSEEREYEKDVPYADQKVVRVFQISAERAARNPEVTL